MKATEILKNAADLIAKPNGWTQRTYARNSSGVPVLAEDVNACSFCILGALNKFSNREIGYEIEPESRAARRAVWNVLLTDYSGAPPARFNDDPKTTQDDVVNVLRKAEKLLGDQELQNEA